MNVAKTPNCNVEIKATIRDFDSFCTIAKEVSNTSAIIILQEDTFFDVPKGRLKLRKKTKEGKVEEQLIYYDRPDTPGPKTSSFYLVQGSSVEGGLQPLQDLLTACLGVRGRVLKTRHLYLLGQTRLHVDRVVGLGDFMELEVVLKEGQSAAEGEVIAEDIRRKLGVRDEDLLSGAYMDMIEKKT
ncbi:uncharacterized protein LOC108679054 [Hyalella azteca]|uniref:Uncharacterized protein LOC108679054 n=1 Tax=Hyalella azteca TaxID=294128 RepID=A0A8B7PA76_HYAAZ|nr:uncharacterized protein LOC108679054 [Hyalella azteca]